MFGDIEVSVMSSADKEGYVLRVITIKVSTIVYTLYYDSVIDSEYYKYDVMSSKYMQ